MMLKLSNLILNSMLQAPSDVFFSRRPLLLREQVLSHRAPPLPRQVQGLHRHVRGQVQSGRRPKYLKNILRGSFLIIFVPDARNIFPAPQPRGIFQQQTGFNPNSRKLGIPPSPGGNALGPVQVKKNSKVFHTLNSI